METEFQNAVGKSVGEIMRDISEFLSTPYLIHPQKQIDLCTLVPELNMGEQLSFALLSEACTQGWDWEAAEGFYRRAVSSVLAEDTVNAMVSAFREPEGEAFLTYQKKYGNRFSALDGSYWATALALGIDAGQVSEVMQYLRLFTVCLMEFVYMGNRNPSETYTWIYYESFRAMLDDLTAPPEADPLPLKVRAIGGSAGKRESDGYMLSLGVDIENPNPDRMARNVCIDITLKDCNGEVITVIRDRIENIDPAAIYHYGVTKKVHGAATAGISAKASATSHLKLSTPIMKHIRLGSLRLSQQPNGIRIAGDLTTAYDRSVKPVTLHYQFLNADNKILGGGCEWLFDGIEPEAKAGFTSNIAVPIQNVAKAVYSVDFDAMELVK